MVVKCFGCENPILDRYIHNVLEKSWHAKCLQCWDCKAQLSDRCFTREGKMFCRSDFLKRYATKCAKCDKVICATELVRKARNKVFHIKCFTCILCQKLLSTGDELYFLDDSKFVCKSDYVLQLEKKRNIDSEDEIDNEDLSNNIDDLRVLDLDEKEILGDEDCTETGSSSGKRRGPRTTIKAKQLETLKAAFIATPKPTRHIREQLAQETGLNMRVIQVWFQNRRSKERRMKQLSVLGARRHFFRHSRRMRILRSGVNTGSDEASELSDATDVLPSNEFAYYQEQSFSPDFPYSNRQSFRDYLSNLPIISQESSQNPQTYMENRRKILTPGSQNSLNVYPDPSFTNSSLKHSPCHKDEDSSCHILESSNSNLNNNFNNIESLQSNPCSDSISSYIQQDGVASMEAVFNSRASLSLVDSIW